MTRAPFAHPVRVYYEDTDSAGVVYYANYLRFMERARSEWMAAHALTPSELEQRSAIVFVVTHVDVAFRQPARLGDLLAVGVEVLQQRGARFELRQDIRRDGQTLVAATVTLACVDRHSFRPRRIPLDLEGACT